VVPRRSDEESHEELKKPERGLTASTRLVGILIVLAAVVSFVVQNDQSVTVKFWFVTSHIHLVWLIIVCLVVGAVGEVGLRRVYRRRRAQRSKAQ
jgi:uncharacterized integral membrane protein